MKGRQLCSRCYGSRQLYSLLPSTRLVFVFFIWNLVFARINLKLQTPLKPAAFKNFVFDWELCLRLCEAYRFQNLVGLELPIKHTLNFIKIKKHCKELLLQEFDANLRNRAKKLTVELFIKNGPKSQMPFLVCIVFAIGIDKPGIFHPNPDPTSNLRQNLIVCPVVLAECCVSSCFWPWGSRCFFAPLGTRFFYKKLVYKKLVLRWPKF